MASTSGCSVHLEPAPYIITIYKQFHSMILLAIADAKYRFIYVDIGAMGQASDGGIWKRSSFFEHLYDHTNPLRIPTPSDLSAECTDVPYFLVGDDAFPLTQHLLKPYPYTGLTRKQRVYNYRLSRGRRVIENTFGILVAKFQIFHRSINMLPEGVQRVIAACVVLHNMCRDKCGKQYMPEGSVDQQTRNDISPGAWRQHTNPLESLPPIAGRNTYRRAKMLRDQMADYFVTPAGELPWQYESAHV